MTDRHLPGYQKRYRERQKILGIGRTHEYKKREFERRGTKRSEYVSKRKPFLRDIIAHDGEGIMLEDGISQNYVLFMSSVFYGPSSKLGRSDECINITNENGLTTEVIFKHLFTLDKLYPGHIHVGYGFRYDCEMFLCSLPLEKLIRLQRDNWCYWKNYRIEYIPRKYIQISRYSPTDHGYPMSLMKPLQTITIWDVIGFFGMVPFVDALMENFTDSVERRNLHINKIAEEKKRRTVFKFEELERIKEYCQLEVLALKALMNNFQKDCIEAEIFPRRYDGAGALAAYLLDKSGVKDCYGTLLPSYPSFKFFKRGEIPYPVQIASQHAYSGGHVEMFKIGNWKSKGKNGIHKDLVSAYPAQMVDLPSLSDGTWSHRKNNFDLTSKWTLSLVYWRFPDEMSEDWPFYPFFYRTRDSRILYPSQGYNWVYGPELKTGLQYLKQRGEGKIEIIEQWVFTETKEKKRPFAIIREKFNLRKKWKKEGRGGARVLKGAINSYYGKLAQRVGYDEKTGKLPPFFNLIYAGLITSGTRAEIMKAMLIHPEAVIAVATDGIWSLKDLDGLNDGTDLGQWECTEFTEFTSIQAGIYFEKNPGEKLKTAYRGFEKASIKRGDVLKAWREGKRILRVPTIRFQTFSNNTTPSRIENWRRWLPEGERIIDEQTGEIKFIPGRKLSIMPTGKRVGNGKKNKLWLGLFSTRPAYNEFVPYDTVTCIEDLRPEHLSKKHPLPWEKLDLDDEVIAAQEEREMRVSWNEGTAF